MMNDVLEKAKKLLALRDRAGTRGEAEAAARALAKMLDKHRITMAELQAHDGNVESIVADQETPLIVDSVDDSLLGAKKDVAKQDALIETDEFDLYRGLHSPYLCFHRDHTPQNSEAFALVGSRSRPIELAGR